MKKRQILQTAFFGPQGSGKGTQALLLSKKWRIPAISTGDLFRQEVRRKTAIGKKAHRYMKKGVLVPLEITLGVLQKRLRRSDAKRGFILDGYPRSLTQAKRLKNITDLNVVVVITLPKREVIRRLAGRRLCPKGHIYHVSFKPPKRSGVCDVDGMKLVQRTDEHPLAIAKRLAIYNKQTKPLVGHYREDGVTIVRINGNQSIKKVHAGIVKALQPHR